MSSTHHKLLRQQLELFLQAFEKVNALYCIDNDNDDRIIITRSPRVGASSSSGRGLSCPGPCRRWWGSSSWWSPAWPGAASAAGGSTRGRQECPCGETTSRPWCWRSGSEGPRTETSFPGICNKYLYSMAKLKS